MFVGIEVRSESSFATSSNCLLKLGSAAIES